MTRGRSHGRALVLLGALALVRAAWPSGELPVHRAGTPISLRLEELRGKGFRLLPGVGPVLAERLEAARRANGGALDRAAASRVRGVGPSLLAHWRRIGSL